MKNIIYPTAFYLLTYLLISCAGTDNQQNTFGPGTYTLTLDKGWRFVPGDDSLYARPGFNDSEYDTIEVGKNWLKAGYPAVVGHAWYRLQLTVPGYLRSNAYFQKGGYLLLDLGAVGDADETFFNGIKVGGTGSISPFVPAMRNNRLYQIPDSIINFDGPNLIAVRVYAESERAGIYRYVPTLSSDISRNYVSQKWEFANSTSGIYAAGDSVMIDYVLSDADTGLPQITEVHLVLKEDMLQADSFNTYTAYPLRDSLSTSVRFAVAAGKPGYYRAQLLSHGANGDTLLNTNFRWAVSPEEVQLPPTEPEDFHDFWKNTKKELAQINPDFRLQKVDSLCTARHNVYLVSMKSWGNTEIKAWYTTPKRSGRYPAVLELPWFTGALPPHTDSADICFLTLHTRGHGMSAGTVHPGFPGYLTEGIGHQNDYIYRGAFMDARRATDFLFSRPEVDTARVAVMGISQGGGLAIAATALDNRIAYSCFSVPFLSRWDQYFNTAKWPKNEFDDYLAAHPGTTLGQVLKVLYYHDVSHLAQWIKCPVYMIVGLQDPVCPPQINFAAYNRIKSEKEVKVYPHGDHGAGSNKEMLDKIKARFEIK